MQRSFGLILLAVLIGGGIYLWQNYELIGLNRLNLRPQSADSDGFLGEVGPDFGSGTGPRIRIMSLSSPILEPEYPQREKYLAGLAKWMRSADIVAVHGLRTGSESAIPSLLDALNAAGDHYDYVAGPRSGPYDDLQRCVFFFDSTTIETDRRYAYAVRDPADLLRHEPFVGWFRARSVEPNKAFTFSLLLAQIDEWEPGREWSALDAAWSAVIDDGRREDDVILLGGLGAEDGFHSALRSVRGVRSVTADLGMYVPTPATRDTMWYVLPGTCEFVGRGGYADSAKRLGVSAEVAAQLVPNASVWAEFYPFEGGRLAQLSLE
jgi:hypothetical protein